MSDEPKEYVAIKSNPAELEYAKYTCKLEAEAVGNRVEDAIAAATPDLDGGGFASGFANGLQGTLEGIDARNDYYKACIARAGYAIK